MIESGQKTSLLIPSQLPEFVRDDPAYANFVLFLKAYYEWLEQTGQVTDRTKNILNYVDIDKTSEEFLNYFYNEFLPYFPQDILADKVKVAKIARELYQSKGTQASFKFLFKTLFNSEVDFFFTKDAVFRASAGKWYVARSLRLDSTDLNFLNCVNYRIFGETSKSIATIEAAIVSGDKIQIFVSDIQRLFQSGENVRVVDSNNQNVLFGGQVLSAKIVGQISQVLIDPNNRGLLYRPGDPVIVFGGLSSNTGIGATAVVGETTSGSIQRISVVSGGYGYRENPNTIINITNAPGAIVQVSSVDPAANGVANVAFVPTDGIGLKASVLIGAADYNFSNIAISNSSTTLANAFTFTGFTTFPISSLIVLNSGGGISSIPSITAQSQFNTDIGTGNLRNLGILAPIQIANTGTGYAVNDTIIFTGGSGAGAAANITAVGANGEIEKIDYVYPTGTLSYPLGGFGYRSDALPVLTISSSGGSDGSVFVPGILGDGAVFSTSVDRVGSITSINILNPGEDYVEAPGVSLKVQDIVIANVAIGDLPLRGETVYQGPDVANSSYRATVAGTEVLVPNGDPLQTLYRLRVFNYNASPVFGTPIKIDGDDNTIIQISNQYPNFNAATRFDSTGLITYGDGTANATATFLNGLSISQGQYLDTTGQPSAFDVLQSEIYNNFNYQITLDAEIAKYRDTLLNLVHPAGMKVIGRYAMKSNAVTDFTASSFLETGQPLGYYTGDPGSYVTMSSTWDNASNNIVNFEALVGANLENFIASNNNLLITLSNGFQIASEVDEVFVSDTANTVTLKDNVWLTYANVAFVTANASSNVINITSLTGSYDIVNNGNYSNTQYPLKDIVYAGDKILVANNTEKTVQSVDWEGGTITLTTSLANTVNSLMSVQRTVLTSDVIIYGPIGIASTPELVTQNNLTIITQDNEILLIG